MSWFQSVLRSLFLCLCAHVANPIFLVRPFLKGPVRIETPTHSFWPWIPVAGSKNANNVTQFFQAPDHNFWPFIPVNITGEDNSTYFGLPDHNFWPFVPVAPPQKNRTEQVPLPSTTPFPALPKPKIGYNYAEILSKSILFYEAQRSGWLPENRKVRWRGHSGVSDKGESGEDLSGGWYDAGDYVKFGFPMAGATSMLLLGLVEFRDTYEKAGLLADMLDCVKWPLDYFIKAHPAKFVFYAQVADPYVDHSYWGRPEDMDMYRPAYKLTPDVPGSDIIAETAAAMAAGSIAFRKTDKNYSDLLLRRAQDLFEFADRYRGIYSDSLPIVQEFYSSSGYEDELSWAAAWLYKATRSERYLVHAEEKYQSTECWAVSWDAKDCLAAILLFQLTKRDKYRYDIERTMAAWMPSGSVPYTTGGLAFRSQWGPLRYTANMATLALLAANAGIRPLEYRLWARQQIHYMLGDAGRSYVIGFGENYPRRPHHASSSCYPPPADCSWSEFTSAEPNPIILYGALVGGPSFDDSFSDSRGDYYQNEVTCDYNAGFQSAVAGLLQLEMREKKILTPPPATSQDVVQETVQHPPNSQRSLAPESLNGNHQNRSLDNNPLAPPKTVTEKRLPPPSTLERLLTNMLQNRYHPPGGHRPKVFKRQGFSRETRQNEREVHQHISQPQFFDSNSFHPSKRHDRPKNDSAKRERDDDQMMAHWQKYSNTVRPQTILRPPSRGQRSQQSRPHHAQDQRLLTLELSTTEISNKVTLIKNTNKNVQQQPFFVQKEKSSAKPNSLKLNF